MWLNVKLYGLLNTTNLIIRLWNLLQYQLFGREECHETLIEHIQMQRNYYWCHITIIIGDNIMLSKILLIAQQINKYI